MQIKKANQKGKSYLISLTVSCSSQERKVHNYRVKLISSFILALQSINYKQTYEKQQESARD